MASLRNSMKVQKVHRERHQIESRSNFGPLEKKKDYVIRARDQNEKRAALQKLRQKALEKNPDEFHFHMINSQIRNGVHKEKVEDTELTITDLNEDLNYVTHRRSQERKKIEKLKCGLHLAKDLFSDKPENSHIIFVDDEDDKDGDAAVLLDTDKTLLSRPFNRLRTDQLKQLDTSGLEEMSSQENPEQQKMLKELTRRIERENKLRILQEKLEVKKRLMICRKKGQTMPKLIKEETNKTAAVYEWPKERKK